MMKKVLALILVILSLVAVLAACGDGKTEDKKNEGSAAGTNPPGTTTPPVEDTRWDHEVVAPEMEAIVAAAEAYYNRRRFIQYDQLGMNRITKDNPRYEFCTPETATVRKIVHMDCGVFLRNVFINVLNYTTPSATVLLDPGYANANGERVYYWKGTAGQTKEDEEKAKAEMLAVMQPGDILYYNYVDNNHLFLYLGKGKMIHCTGSDYNHNTYKDGMEAAGSIIKTTVDEAFSSRDIFDEKNKVALLRPLNVTKNVNEQAMIRAEKLQDIVINKTSSAPEGISVTPGEQITIKLSIKNNRSEDATFHVEDIVPEGMEYVSGADKFSGDTLSWDIKATAKKTTSVEYTFKVKKDASLIGKLIPMDETTIEGYLLNDTPAYIGVTLAKDKQEAITAIKGTDLKATTEAELIKAVYDKVGLPVSGMSSEQYLKDLFLNYPNDNQLAQTTPVMNTDTYAGLTFMPGLYGGKACYSMGEEKGIRTRRVYEYNIIPGDIIVRGLMLSEGNSNLYVYLGDDKAVTVKNGQVKEEKADIILESLHGQCAFMILRPSLCYPMDMSSVAEMNAPKIKTQPVTTNIAFGERKGPAVEVQQESGVIYSYQWYKNAENKNSGGTAIEGATEAQCVIPTSAFNAGDVAYLYCVVTATRVFDSKTVITTSNTAKLTVEKGTTNVLLIGSGAIKRDGKFDMGEYLSAMLKADGTEVTVDYITKGNDYNIWETGLTGTEQATVKAKLEEKTYACIVMQLGRDYVLTTGSTRGKELAAYKNIVKMAKEMSPDCQIMVLLGPWRQDTSTPWLQRYNDAGIMGADGHKQAILKYYEDHIKPLADVKVIDAVTTFDAAIKAGVNTLGEGTSIDYPNVEGAYLIASLIYGQFTGKAPVGLNVFTSSTGVVSAENAQKLQEIASDHLKLTYTATKLDPSKETNKPAVTEPKPDEKPAEPQNPAVEKPANADKKVLVVGSGVLKRGDSYDTVSLLQKMFNDSGKKIAVDAITLGTDYNMWESGLTGANQSKIKTAFSTNAYDYLVIQLSRDYALFTGSTREKELTAFKNILDIIKASSPKCKVVVCTGPWRQDPTSNWIGRYTNAGIMGIDGHIAAISTYYNSYYAPLNTNGVQNDICAAFKKALDANIDPYESATSDLCGNAGEYLIACMNYAQITDESPVGLTTADSAGKLTAAELKTLQQIAADVALKK